MRQVTIFRLDHRIVRDQRITSHVALTARAMGASDFLYSGEKDPNMEQSITDVVTRWGGKFAVSHSDRIKKLIKSHEGISVHLSMYGESHLNTLKTLQAYPDEDLLIIVGGSKVPPFIYDIADFNTAIGWQPHSEVAAIAIFLYDLIADSEHLYKSYQNASMELGGTGKKSQRSERFRKD